MRLMQLLLLVHVSLFRCKLLLLLLLLKNLILHRLRLRGVWIGG